jgi:hypothetical protein
MPVIGKGTVYLRIQLNNGHGGEQATLKFLNTLHTPNVPHNLVSLTRMLATGKFVQTVDAVPQSEVSRGDITPFYFEKWLLRQATKQLKLHPISSPWTARDLTHDV